MITVIGTCFVDIKGVPTGKYTPTGRNLGDIRIVHGGVGRNVAENLANLNMAVEFISVLDHSVLSKSVYSHLQNCGVHMGRMQYNKYHGVGTWEVILDDAGDLAGSISSMPDLTKLKSYINRHIKDIVSGTDSIVLEYDLDEHITSTVLQYADLYHKPVYAVVGNMHVVLSRKDLLSKVSCFVCNEYEAFRLSQYSFSGGDPSQMLEPLENLRSTLGVSSMVITLGRRGAIYCNDHEAGYVLAVPTKVVDTCGAGDAFFSGVVAGLENKQHLKEAVGFGTHVASKTLLTHDNCYGNLDSSIYN